MSTLSKFVLSPLKPLFKLRMNEFRAVRELHRSGITDRKNQGPKYVRVKLHRIHFPDIYVCQSRFLGKILLPRG